MMEKTPLQLSSIYAENFRNLVFHEPLKLNNLNILVGSNGSGKSNFLNLVFFFNEILTGNGGGNKFNQAIAKYGGDSMVNKKSQEEPVQIAIGWKTNDKLEEMIYDFSFSIFKHTPNIIYEKIYDKDSKHFYKSKDFEHSPDAKGYFSKSNLTSSLEIETILYTPLEKRKKPEYIAVCHEMVKSIVLWQKYNASGMSMRDVSRAEPKLGLTDKYLSPNGENLPIIIKNLFDEYIDFEEELNDAMKDILPQTRRIRPSILRHSVTLEWFCSDLKTPFFLDEMSDGTVRMLCWATVLLSPELPKLIIIDEPELSLHPAWMKPLGRWIKRAAQRTQVIVSTHSPDLLDEFTDHWQNVIRFDKEPNGTDYTPVSLADQKALKKSIEEEGFELGDLYRAGDPSLGGWPW